jgi:hypothetical protein
VLDRRRPEMKDLVDVFADPTFAKGYEDWSDWMESQDKYNLDSPVEYIESLYEDSQPRHPKPRKYLRARPKKTK